jgi:hypothetical protein
LTYLRVKNWEKFQHYHQRDAKWIKLYTGLLEDYEFLQLEPLQRHDLIMIWLLAQRLGNKIPNDPAYIASKIGSKRRPAINLFIQRGFLILNSDASNLLAPPPPPPASPEERRGEEKRGEIQQCDSANAEGVVVKVPSADDLGRIWNENRGAMRRVALPLNGDRKRKAKARLAETPDLDRWRAAIARAAKSKFCRGLVTPAEEGRKPWIGNFEWLIRPNTLDRIEEGVYDSQPQSPRLVPQAAPVLTDEERKFIEETGTDEQRKRLAQAPPA